MKNFKLSEFQINESENIESALAKIESNALGFVVTIDQQGKVTGLATDGDVRRGLLEGIKLNETISKCANSDFISVTVDAPREQVIKKLDGHIKFIPVINQDRVLCSLVTKDNFPLKDEKSIYIRSRAPVRISFGGGGSDLTHYFKDGFGAVMNTTISVYSHATMRVRQDSKVIISSLDLNDTLYADDLDAALIKNESFGLILSILHVLRPKHGFELELNSDFPIGSGLGGSASISAAVLGCFNVLRKDKWNQHEIAEIAFQAERLYLGIAGGWQDQYAAVFGGFNFIEFHPEENIISPIRIHPNIAMELEECLVLCDTGIDHNSGNIHENQRKTMTSNAVRELVKENVGLVYDTRKYLLKGDLENFARCLDEAWKLKRNFSSMISNDHIDAIYNGAMDNGALGGKLLGAGGGGFFIFYVPAFSKRDLISYLKSQKLTIQPFRFESDGLKTWTSREREQTLIEEEKYL